MRSLFSFAILFAFSSILFNASTYTLNLGQQAMVFRFNELVHEEQREGLHFKLPFIDEVKVLGAYVYELDGKSGTFLALNAEPIVVDYYITYQIKDLQRFQEQVAGSVTRLQELLEQGSVTAIQENIDDRSQASILAEGREEMRLQVYENLLGLENQYGIALVDFRVNRVDLPEQTKAEVEASMIQERTAEKEDILTNATARATIIEAEAERNAARITDQAARQAQALIGMGTREEIALKDQGFGIDPDFFTFYKRVEQVLEGSGLPSGQFVVSDVDAYLGEFLGFDRALASAQRLPADFAPLQELGFSPEMQAMIDAPDLLGNIAQ